MQREQSDDRLTYISKLNDLLHGAGSRGSGGYRPCFERAEKQIRRSDHPPSQRWHCESVGSSPNAPSSLCPPASEYRADSSQLHDPAHSGRSLRAPPGRQPSRAPPTRASIRASHGPQQPRHDRDRRLACGLLNAGRHGVSRTLGRRNRSKTTFYQLLFRATANAVSKGTTAPPKPRP